jgi:hypothetical protein
MKNSLSAFIEISHTQNVKVMKEVFNAMIFERFVFSFQIAIQMSEKPILK